MPPPAPRFGSSWREWTFALLVFVYAGVSVVAYTDHPRSDTSGPALSDTERDGLDVWRRNNCQVCHQIYGFGGFLGPDLTNAVTETTPDSEFARLLDEGYGKMPALHLPEQDQRAVLAFLRAMNRTGRSQPSPDPGRRPVRPAEHWSLVAREAGLALDARAARGRDLMAASQCGACHVPFMEGVKRAPDLTAAAFDRSVARLEPVLRDGKGNMPAYRFERTEVEDLSAWLNVVAENRAELVKANDRLLQREGFTWRDLVWWEYK